LLTPVRFNNNSGRHGRGRRVGRLYVADDRLGAVIDVDMLDPDVLVAAVTKPTNRLNLHRISSQQSGRR